MSSERALRWAQLTEAPDKLAATFEKRRLGRSNMVELVSENIAELTAAGIIVAGHPSGAAATLPEHIDLLRVIAGGCGATAFALSAALAGEQPREQQQQWGQMCDSAVFLGLAERAYQLAVQRIKDRSNTSAADPVRLPGTQFATARMRAGVATMTALLTRPTQAAASWISRYYIAAGAEQVTAAAIELIGARDREAGQRIGWIWQDLKTGPVLEFSNDLALEVIGKTVLGIDPGESPRWL